MYINGSEYEKSFTRKFIGVVCRDEIRHRDINWYECTRKRLIVNSKRAVDCLTRLNKKIYWPNGQQFRCKMIGKSGDGRDNEHRPYRNSTMITTSFTRRRQNQFGRKNYILPTMAKFDVDERVNANFDDHQNPPLALKNNFVCTTNNIESTAASDKNANVDEETSWYDENNFVDVDLGYENDMDDVIDNFENVSV